MRQRRDVDISLPFHVRARAKLSRDLVHPIADQLGSSARELLAAWSLLPKDEHVPYRESFDPMAVVRILPVLTIFERMGDGEWCFRLAGTEIDRRWGRRVTGLSFAEFVEPKVAPKLRGQFDQVVGTPCGSWSTGEVAFPSGRSATLELLHLPLRAKDGTVSLILGSGDELSARPVRERDQPRSIGSIAHQRFFDIGAGLPSSRALPRVDALRVNSLKEVVKDEAAFDDR